MVMPNPTDAAQRWATNFGASGDRWQSGVESVTVAPGALAARSADLWLANTTAAKGRYAANSAAVTREAWISQTVSKGRGRLASGAQASITKVEQVYAKLFPYIQQTVNSLPPRGDLEQNIARSATFARGMAKFKTG